MTYTERVGADRRFLPIDNIEVEVVHWPDDAKRDQQLAREGRARLLLVEPGATPPADWDHLTDWIRLPADDLDIWSRIAVLQWRAHRRPAPRLDEHDVLWRGTQWVALSRTEARVLEPLMDQSGAVVSRRRLALAGWEHGAPSPRSVDTYIKRLRRRLPALGLGIRTVRSRGYALTVSDLPGAPDPAPGIVMTR